MIRPTSKTRYCRLNGRVCCVFKTQKKLHAQNTFLAKAKHCEPLTDGKIAKSVCLVNCKSLNYCELSLSLYHTHTHTHIQTRTHSGDTLMLGSCPRGPVGLLSGKNRLFPHHGGHVPPNQGGPHNYRSWGHGGRGRRSNGEGTAEEIRQYSSSGPRTLQMILSGVIQKRREDHESQESSCDQSCAATSFLGSRSI